LNRHLFRLTRRLIRLWRYRLIEAVRVILAFLDASGLPGSGG
jgi:hypothetical protein